MGSGIDRLRQLVNNPATVAQPVPPTAPTAPVTPPPAPAQTSGVERLRGLVGQYNRETPAPAITPASVNAEEPTVTPTPAKTPSLADATNLQETRDALERQYNDALAANGGQPSTQSDALMKQMLNLDKWLDQQHSNGGYEDNVVNTVRGGLEGSAGGFVGAARFATEARESGEDRLKNLVAGLYNPEQRAAYEAAFNANRERQHENGIAADPQKLIETSDRLADQSAHHIEQAKEGLGTVGRTLVDVGVAGTQMLGDAVGNLIVPGGGLALMGIRSFGSASEDARRKGASLGRQFAYALPVAATEVLTEKMFDGLSGIFGKGAADDAVEALISKLAKTQAGQNALRALANMGGEALEEVVSGLVDPMLQNIIDDRQGEGAFRNYTPEAFAEMGYSALVGGILGGIGGSVDIAKNPDLNAKIAAEQAAENPTPAQPQNVTAQALGASQATPNTTPVENAVQRDAGASNATQPTDTLAQVILDIQRSGAEKATKAQVEAVMNDAASMQRLGVEPATAENGKTASQVRGEVRDALAQAIVESQTQGKTTVLDTNPATHTPAQQRIIAEYKGAVDNSLRSFLEESINNPDLNSGVYSLAPVSSRAANDIKNTVGIDVAGYKTVIERRMARHINNRHGSTGTSDHSMQDLNDVARMQYVIDNYDSIEPGGTVASYSTVKPNGKSRSAESVKYVKKVNGTYYVVEAVPNTKAKTVYIVSAYMSNNAGDAQLANAKPDVNVQNVDVASPAGSTVPQAAQVVNPAAEITPGDVEKSNKVDNANGSAYNSVQTGGVDYVRTGGIGDAAEGVPGTSGGLGAGDQRRADAVRNPELVRVRGSLSSESIETLRQRGIVNVELQDSSADPAAFSSALDAARTADTRNGWAVTPKSIEDIRRGNLQTYLGPNSAYGYALAPGGDIEGVFSNKSVGAPKGVLKFMMPQAIANGGTKLDCYGPALVQLYSQYGFIPVARVSFNPEYANPGWTPNNGTPDIYVMLHNGDTADAVVAGYGSRTVPSQAELDALPLMDYDDAMAYRDGLLSKRNAPATTSSDVTPGGTGAAAAGFNQEAGPQVQTQNKTVTEGVAYSDGQKRMVAPGTHERISEGESMSRAADGFYVDSDGNVDIDRSAQDLLEDDHWTGVMNDRAMLVQQMAIQRATETGRGWNLVRKLAAKIEKMGTIAGQSLQARKKWIADSGDNIVTAAASLLEQAGDKMQDGELRRGVNADEVLSDIAVLASQYQNAVETGNTAALIDIIRRTAQQRHTTGLFRRSLSNMMGEALDYVAKQGDIDFLQRFAANGIYAIASDSMKTDAGTAIVSARRMAMLSKAATILRNLIGNGTFDIADTTSNNISVPLDVLLSAFTGTRSVAGEAYMSKAKIDGSLDGFWKSLLEVGLDVDTDGGMGKYETGGKRTFRMASPTARLLSTMEKWQGYAMTTTDEIAKGGIRAETQRGIDRLTARGRVKDDSLVDAAQQTALRRTFQDDTAASRLTLGARRALNNLHLGKVGAGDIAIPFAQVPANLAARAVDYSPIGLARGIAETAKVLKAAHNGTLTAAQQRKAVLDLGAGINGTALIAGAAALALKGVLKVKGVLGGDDDKEALETQGGQSGTQLNVDSVLRWANGEDTDWRDGDTLVSIGFLDPINAMLATGALIAADATDEDGANVGSILKDSLNGTLSAVMELPVMETLRNFTQNMRYSKETTEGGQFTDALFQFLADQTTSLVPNAVKGIAQGRDEYQRNAYTKKDLAGQTLDAIKASIPGLRETLPVKQDSYGRDMMTEEDPLLRALNANIMPGKITAMREDALTTELDRLNEKTGEAGFYPNRKPPASISVDGEKTELTMEQQRRYQAEAGGMQLATGTAVMGLPSYRNAPAGVQAEIMDNVRDYARQLAKSRVVGADTDKWVSNAQRAQRDLHMSTAEWLAQYTILGGSEGLFGSSQYPKTLTMLNDGGLTLKEWGNMSRWLGDNGTGSNGAVVKEDVVDYITAHFDADDRAQIFDAYKGSRTWKNPF